MAETKRWRHKSANLAEARMKELEEKKKSRGIIKSLKSKVPGTDEYSEDEELDDTRYKLMTDTPYTQDELDELKKKKKKKKKLK